MKPFSGKLPERDVDHLNSLVYPGVLLFFFKDYDIRGGMAEENRKRILQTPD